jgi:hypothetical protein
MLALRESRPRARLVRHNRPVTAAACRRSFLFAALVAAAVAGCDGGGSGDADAPATTFDSPDAELAWEGTLACADCDGIETRLRLQHGNGVVAQYELVEAFLAGDATEYFREQGRWRRDGRILRLQSSSGASACMPSMARATWSSWTVAATRRGPGARCRRSGLQSCDGVSVFVTPISERIHRRRPHLRHTGNDIEGGSC